MLWLNLLWFIAAALVLVASGTFLVRSLARISHFLRLTEFAAAFIIMAIASSLPELFVGISSAMAKNTALALGNIIGANILDITLITGIFIILGRGISAKTKKIRTNALAMIAVVGLPLVLFLIGNSISRIDGIILIAVFLLYAQNLIRQSRKFEKPYEEEKKVGRKEIVLTVLLFIASLVLLFISANFLIKYASALAIDLNLPSIFIGLFLISIGTTLPELTFGARAILMGHEEMSIGDQIGTVIVNSTLILGVTALIWPITADFMAFFIAAIFLLFSAFLFTTFIQSAKKLDVGEGIALVLLYVFFILIEFYVKGLI